MVGRLIAAGERSARIVTLAKLSTVGLSMIWGFAVTFVFVRAIPAADFRVFLLLVAFNNFTVSAEFGFTNVIYARMRRWWLAGCSEEGQDRFRHEEVGVLFLFLGLLILGSTLLVGAGLLTGLIATSLPGIFLIFFAGSALNILLLLAKRAMAALDRNLVWEGTDILRRVAGLAVLLSVLVGTDLMLAVILLLALNLAGAAAGIMMIHRASRMRTRHWFSVRAGGGHIRRTYLHDIGASAALTMSEVAAYNGPYFMIAAVSKDATWLVLFDFAFKMIRAVATAIRATIEGALPRLTKLWFAGDRATFGAALMRAGGVAIVMALLADILLLAMGQRLFDTLYHGRARLEMADLILLCSTLVALALMCTSVYVQGALGRFGELLKQSLPFLLGSLLAAPAAVAMVGPRAAEAFMALYALVFASSAALHMLSLRRLRGR
jgi:hypothetical protein